MPRSNSNVSLFKPSFKWCLCNFRRESESAGLQNGPTALFPRFSSQGFAEGAALVAAAAPHPQGPGLGVPRAPLLPRTSLHQDPTRFVPPPHPHANAARKYEDVVLRPRTHRTLHPAFVPHSRTPLLRNHNLSRALGRSSPTSAPSLRPSRSEKSEHRRLAIKTLLELSASNPGKKGSKLATQVPASEFVPESFGNARTLLNPNASRFGKYTELQVSARGRLQGIKTLDYYLERNRISGAPNGEQNFHIVYYLVAGASPGERQHLHLLDKTTYGYFGQHRSASAPNTHPRTTLCPAQGRAQNHGPFEAPRHASVCPPGRARAGKTKLIKKGLSTVFLDPDCTSDSRDDLAKTLYSVPFAWLNQHINQHFCKDNFVTFIGLFDLPSPQNFSLRPNSLSSASTLSTSASRAGRSSASSRPTSPSTPWKASFRTPQSLLQALGNHSSFKTGGALNRAGFSTFTISHFNGPVTYSAEGFLARNLDALSPRLCKPAARRRHRRGRVGEPVHQGSVQRARDRDDGAPSERGHDRCGARLPVCGEHPQGRRSSLRRRAAAPRRSQALDTLFEMQVWHVFCVNPNESQLLNQLERRSIKEVGMTFGEFRERYGEEMEVGGVSEGGERERVEHAKTVFGLGEKDVVLGILLPSRLPQVRGPDLRARRRGAGVPLVLRAHDVHERGIYEKRKRK
ncbi:P-loop containing nucleoside triphosphate hydrolase protein [Mycena vulgaris]|nr:P-loop containing nucleoside triphosphate hydrolase protein [Mycena vulgaris]